MGSPDRLAALRHSGLWHSGAEESFDRLTRVAANVLRTPVALVTLVGAESQYLKSAVGPEGAFVQGTESPISHSFCRHVVASGGPLVVDDATCHPLVRDNGAVTDHGVLSYVGVPIRAGEHVLGAFCVLGHERRDWSVAELETVADIAAGVQAAIDYRLEAVALREQTAVLRQTSAELHLFASQLPAVGWTTDRDLRLTSAHGSALPSLGVPGNAIGRTLQHIVGTDDRSHPAITAHLGALRGESGSYRGTLGGACYDVTVEPFREGDAITGAIALAVDVTEQLAHEREQLERDATLDVHRDLVSNLEVGVYVLELDDPDEPATLRVVEANTGSELASGIAADDVVGRLVVDAFANIATPPALVALREATLGACPVSFGDVEADGKSFDVRAFPLPGLRLALTFVNVTEQRALEARARQSQKLEAVGQLAGGVAHDFNNLLTAITGYTTLSLDRAAGDEELRADLNEVLSACDRARDLTRQLLAFGRQQMLQPRPLDLNAVIADAERLLDRVLGDHVAIDCRLGVGVPVVLADRGQLEQVLVNLAVNARDAMPGGGTIVLTTGIVTEAGADGQPRHYASLEVSDTGCGMTDDVREKIFEPFFTTKEFGEGHGLGLATVHGIVQQSGGQISVVTEPGRGTTFTVLLPASEAPRLDEPVCPEPAPPSRGCETIVLAEDDELVRKLTSRTLEANGYDVISFADPAEALASFPPTGVDLLVTDVVMPKLSGRELAEKVVAISPKTKVMFVSGYTPDDVLARGIEEDSVEFLQKPFTMGDLGRKVRAVLDGS